MYRVYRYSKYPTYWPAESTVYVDASLGTVEEYVTDSNGTPTLVGNYVGTVTYTNLSEFPTTGRTNRMYIDGSTNKLYRWDTTQYVEVSGGTSIPGGLAGQILSKNTDTDFDYLWIDPAVSTLREYVKAGENITKGQAVYISGAAGASGNVIISKASNATEATSSKTLGLCVQTLTTNHFGYVITNGILTGLNTGSATSGDPVWLGTNGNLIFGLTNKPVAPAHLVYMGVIVRAHSVNGSINVKVQNGFELNEIHDVLVPSASLTFGMVLYRDTTTSLWKAATIENLLGYIPLPSDATAMGDALNNLSTATLSDDDRMLVIEDVTSNPTSKKATLTALKAFLEAYFDNIYTTASAVASLISTALSGYATQTWVNSQGFITSVTGALGYTPENVANKENTTLDTSTTKYPTNNLVKTAVDAKAAKTQTDFISGIIEEAINGTYTLIITFPFAGIFTETVTQCDSGTCTATWKTAGVTIAANAVSSSPDVQTASQAFSAGDYLRLEVTSASTCVVMSFSLKYTRVLA
jgi:hypothetical protein